MPSLPRIRASVLCIHDNSILSLRHEDASAKGFWGVPGGGIEPGESPVAAAIRETREETGYRVELIHDPGLAVEYDFVWKGSRFRCRTHWFGVQPIPGAVHTPRAGDESYLAALRWLPVAEWRQLFPGHVELQAAICRVLGEMAKNHLVRLNA